MRPRALAVPILLISAALLAPAPGARGGASLDANPETQPASALDRVRALIEDRRHAEAKASARELLSAAVARQEPDSLAVAEILDLLVEAIWREGQDVGPEAIGLAERAVRIKENALGSDHLELALSLNRLANLVKNSGDYARARPLYERALAIRERALGPEHPEVASVLHNLGILLAGMGEYDSARERYERAVAIREKALGPGDPSLANSLNSLGNLLKNTGEYGEARRILERALAIREKTLGPDHPWVATTLYNLANLLRLTGDYTRARSLYERALAIDERALGPGHPDMADALTGLGNLLRATGDYAAARPLLERALAIRETALGPDHPELPAGLVGLANLLARMGDHARARSLYERALAIHTRTLGPDHPHVAGEMTVLADLLSVTGDRAAARPLYERALAIWERALGPEHPDLSYALGGLGTLLLDSGDPGAAEPLFRRALAIDERALGPDDPRVATDLVRLAGLLSGSARPAAALDAALRAEEIGRAHLRLTARTLSEREALRYASVRARGLDLALSLAGEGGGGGGGGTGAAGRRVWDALVRSRALVLDEMAARHRTAAGTSDPETAELEGRLQRARERLAKLVVRGPGGVPPAEHRRALDGAREEKEAAERALAERSVAFRQAEAESRRGLEEVAGALEPGSALVAYVRFERAAVPSYMAFVLRAGGKEPGRPAVVPLGAAAEIESAISLWRERSAREAVTGDRPSSEIEAAYRQAGELLRQRIWDPAAVHLGGAARVFVVPDGELNLVDLAALPAGGSGYLVESGPLIHYLSAERDLLQPPPAGGAGGAGGLLATGGLLAVGGPDFDAGAPAARRLDPVDRGAPYREPFRGGLPACGDFASLRFEALRSAPREAGEVAGLWRRRNGATGVDTLEGAAATEAAFKRLAPGRQVLHLATHGFFLAGPCASSPAPSRGGSPALAGEDDPGAAAGESPLLLSGLALAGANRRAAAGPGEEDGILTAEEISALDLRGVEWAVLSACDTGVGEVKAGEGVFGLRRAFAVAGARTVIMSLWSVDDRMVRRWMRALYEGRWAKGLGTAEAMRAADLELLRARREKHESTHPYYWAGFVAAGR